MPGEVHLRRVPGIDAPRSCTDTETVVAGMQGADSHLELASPSSTATTGCGLSARARLRRVAQCGAPSRSPSRIRRGLLEEDDPDPLCEQEALHSSVTAAAAPGTVAISDRAGHRVCRRRVDPEDGVRSADLCCATRGFSLHAAARVGADVRELTASPDPQAPHRSGPGSVPGHVTLFVRLRVSRCGLATIRAYLDGHCCPKQRLRM